MNRCYLSPARRWPLLFTISLSLAAVTAGGAPANPTSRAPRGATSQAMTEKKDPQIEALLAKMTLDEKVGQLTMLADDIRVVIPNINPDVNRRKNDELLVEIRAGRVGSLFNGIG